MKDNPQIGDRFLAMLDNELVQSEIAYLDLGDTYPIESSDGKPLYAIYPKFDPDCAYECYWSEKCRGWIFDGAYDEDEVYEALNYDGPSDHSDDRGPLPLNEQHERAWKEDRDW